MPFLIGFLVYLLTLFHVDKNLADFIGKTFLGGKILKIMSTTIAPMLHLITILAASLFAFILKKKTFFKLAFTYLINVIIFMFIIGVLKIMFGRARPLHYLDSNFYGFSFLGGLKSAFRSFPSSHTAAAFAFFHYFLRLKIIKSKKIAGISCCFLVSSRIFLCEHYISDLILGGFIGWYSTNVAFYLQKKIEQVIRLLEVNTKKLN
jgi:membrane-associated phospholipid phosphatase